MYRNGADSFQKWFENHGDSLLKGWLRAKEDGSEERFQDWVVGEYYYYCRRPSRYEIPYFGIADEPAQIEELLCL